MGVLQGGCHCKPARHQMCPQRTRGPARCHHLQAEETGLKQARQRPTCTLGPPIPPGTTPFRVSAPPGPSEGSLAHSPGDAGGPGRTGAGHTAGHAPPSFLPCRGTKPRNRSVSCHSSRRHGCPCVRARLPERCLSQAHADVPQDPAFTPSRVAGRPGLGPEEVRWAAQGQTWDSHAQIGHRRRISRAEF